MDDGIFVIQYFESPEVDAQVNGVTTVTTTKVIIESGTIEKLANVVKQFVDCGEEVEVTVKHKPSKD